ncbi:HNH endonuclease signature motif containing protein [Micromonospora sp. DT31]|uniref:HNH endonuclease signature motif containing protein n=1 Tax=Micromonospora sp. DT31 TaxID=3393434 RepID=UPI003CF0206F
MADRPPVPAELERRLMIEAGHRCAIPTCRAVGPLQIEHIRDWHQVRQHNFENMIVLCANCHGRKGNRRGQIDRKSLYQYKANLSVVNSRYGELERRVLDFFSRILPLREDAMVDLRKLIGLTRELAETTERVVSLGPESDNSVREAKQMVAAAKHLEPALRKLEATQFDVIEVTRGSHFLLSYLIQDGYLEPAPHHVDNVSIDGRPIIEIYQLTAAGRRFVDRWKNAQPLDEVD